MYIATPGMSVRKVGLFPLLRLIARSTVGVRTRISELPQLCAGSAGSRRPLSTAGVGDASLHAAVQPLKRPRRFPCETCGSTFADRKGLVTHQRIHTGEKPFVCGDCSKAFSDRSALASHARQHTGAKPFQVRREFNSGVNSEDARCGLARVFFCSARSAARPLRA